MSDFSIKPGSTARLTTGAPRSANTDALSKKPPPFTRPAEVDGGRFSNFGHNLANGTRRLFGRPQQPSAIERAEQAAFLDWRTSQLNAFANAAQSGAAFPQARQMQGRPAYAQVNHQATQAAMEENWRQWRVDNPGVSHQVGNQAGVLATYF